MPLPREANNAASDLELLVVPQSFNFCESAKFLRAFFKTENGVRVEEKSCTVLKYS